jgi:hypothetical protein
MTLCGAGITPDLSAQATKKDFSATRSWATETPWAFGATKTCCASRDRLSAGTFSNSVVTATHWLARASRPAASV